MKGTQMCQELTYINKQDWLYSTDVCMAEDTEDRVV